MELLDFEYVLSPSCLFSLSLDEQKFYILTQSKLSTISWMVVTFSVLKHLPAQSHRESGKMALLVV